MAQKKVNTRIQNKHDLEVNWLQATNFIPLPGELIVYDVEVDASGTTLALPSGRTTPYTYERFKIGDGINLVKDLPFVPNKTQAIYYIVGNSTTAGTWTGTHSDITEYYDGLTIAYKVNVAGASDLTLNINNLGAVSVVRNSTTAVTTHYGVDSIIILVYSVDSSGTAYWKVADYDSDTKTSSSNKASTKMYIIGATAQSTSGQTTYSNSKVYIGTDNCLYSNGEKVAVDSHTHSSYANQNAFSNVKVGDTTISADTTTDTLELVAGSNVTLTPDATNDKITITAKDTVYTHPTTSGNKHIPSGGSSGQILRWSADGTATWGSDNNTTYSAGTGISLSGTTFSNSGVRSISTGDTNGTISVNTGGTSAEVAVKGLGSAAYTASSAYAASSHTHNYAGSSSAGGAATSANKVNKNMTIKLNGGSTEGTNLFTFNGSAAKTIDITPFAIGAAASGHSHSVSHTPAGSIGTPSKTSTVASSSHTHGFTPAGTINTPTFTGTEAYTLGPDKDADGNAATVSVGSSGHTHTVTAKGSVSAPTFTGSAVNSGGPSKTASPTASFSESVSNQRLTVSISISGTFASSDHTHSVTAAGTNSAPTFTGSSATTGGPSGTTTVASGAHRHKYTPSGTNSALTFTGTAGTTSSISGTTKVASSDHTHTFTGTEANLTTT